MCQPLQKCKALLGEREVQRDHLIEYLHLFQDKYGHLSAAHMAALASHMRIPMAEVYEVATFYDHFDVVKEGEEAPAEVTIRVCDSLSCALAGSEELIADSEAAKRAKTCALCTAPCMGRCHCAPAAAVGKNYMDHVSTESLLGAAEARDVKPHVEDYQSLQAYKVRGRLRHAGRLPVRRQDA